MVLALVGNQNCGKTTLFNILTGSNQHVGNFPGVTVAQKIGNIKKVANCKLVDLPGIYSIRPYTQEEIITRDFILNGKPDGIINIIDATNIERNLYLTLQLLDLKIPMVIALNMMDEVKKNDGNINISKFSKELGLPVIPISAKKNEGIPELLTAIINVSKSKTLPSAPDFYSNNALQKCILSVSKLIERQTIKSKISSKFLAIKIIEGDNSIKKRLKLTRNETNIIEDTIIKMEKDNLVDRNELLATMRYNFIDNICKTTVIKPKESKQHKRSMKIDAILTNKFLALPIFISIMLLIFYLTFNVIGGALSNRLLEAINYITILADNVLTTYKINPILHSLIIEGIFTGVGSVLTFLPIILVLFLLLSILEDTGYMARIAFIMDKLFSKIGLSGKSFVPMLLGFGCTVPAVMATRTMSSGRDRKITILLAPYMSCSAKIPIYAIISHAFFRTHQVLIMTLLYFIGIITGILIALLLKRIKFSNNSLPFIMELPNYRIPTLKSTIFLMWDKAKDFIEKAFTIIFISTIIIWFLQSFDVNLIFSKNSADCLLASIGKLISPIFTPLGFDNWEIITALISGITAKEAVVSTLGILLNVRIDNLHLALASLFTPLSAFCFLTFTLLYPPCFASIATIKHELNSTWQTICIIILQCVTAWIVTFVIYQMGQLVAWFPVSLK